MSKDFVVGRIVSMGDVPYHKGSVGYDFVAAQRRKDAEALLAAEHRVAEAALKAVYIHVGSEARLTLSFPSKDDRNDFLLALDDLRRLKGEG